MDYEIQLNPLYEHLKLIDVGEVSESSNHPWFNRTLTQVNDAYVRLGVFEPGEFHWHQHADEDEFFFVLDGRLAIDFRDRSVELGPNQGVTVPRGVEHRPRALERTRILMVESMTIQPTGTDAGVDAAEGPA